MGWNEAGVVGGTRHTYGPSVIYRAGPLFVIVPVSTHGLRDIWGLLEGWGQCL